MLPYVTILGKDIYLYGVMVVLAAVMGWVLAMARRRQSAMKTEDITYGYVFILIGVFLGAKLLSILTQIPDIVRDFHLIGEDLDTFMYRYVYSGFVFYGGLVGGIAFALIYAKWQEVPFLEMVRAYLPSIPLVHAIGRVGCFCAGCCYGIPHEQLGIAFHNSQIAPNDIPLLPVQLFECAGNLLICLALVLYMRRGPHPFRGLALYLAAYGVLRFVLEFFRYDAYRGFLWGLSTSQWFCILAWIGAAVLLALARRAERGDGGKAAA